MGYIRLDFVLNLVIYIVFLVFLYYLVKRCLSPQVVYCQPADDGLTVTGTYRHGNSEISGTGTVKPDSFTNAINNLSDAISGVGSLRAGAKVASSLKGRPAAVKIGTAVAVAAIGTANVITTKNLVNQTSTSDIVNRLHPNIARPGSPENPFVHSVNEPFNVFNMLPQWIRDDLALRVPSSTLNPTGEYNLLFMKYNIRVYLMMFSIIMIRLSYFSIWLLKTVKHNKEYLSKNYPKTLGRLSQSKWLDYNIILFQFGRLMFVLVIIQCVFFMYGNYIPGDLGTICDVAVEAKKHV